MERIVGGKYKLGRKIGSGSFGEIYLGERASSLSLSLSSVIVFTTTLYIRFITSYRFFMFSFVAAATHIDTFEIVAVKIVSLFIVGFSILYAIPCPNFLIEVAYSNFCVSTHELAIQHALFCTKTCSNFRVSVHELAIQHVFFAPEFVRVFLLVYMN